MRYVALPDKGWPAVDATSLVTRGRKDQLRPRRPVPGGAFSGSLDADDIRALFA